MPTDRPVIARSDGADQAWQRWLEKSPAVATSGGSGGGRALLISYTFPPTGGSGVQRPAKLSRYLPEFGWQLEVLAAGHDRFPWHDPSLCEELPADLIVHRVPGWEPAALAARAEICMRRLADRLPRSLWKNAHADEQTTGSIRWIADRLHWRLCRWTAKRGLGDGQAGWIAPAARACIARHAHAPFDAIISTGPPHFTHRVAARIARTIGRPWIAELRDPLISDYERDGRQLADAQQSDRLEQFICRRADAIVTTCTALADDLARRYAHLGHPPITAITNGFDRSDLRAAAALSLPADLAGLLADFTLVAAGSFYGRNEIRRLIEPLHTVLDRHPDWRGRVRFILAGTLDAEQHAHWSRHAPSWMSRLGYLDHHTTLALLHKASCAVMTQPDCNHSRSCLPGKLFELLALPTHLLALVPAGSETQQRALAAGGATSVPIERPAAVTEALESIIARHFAGRLDRHRDFSHIDTYDRRHTAAAYARCLNQVRRSDDV